MLAETDFTHWPIDGPRTCKWLLTTMAQIETTPTRRHQWWRQAIGLTANDDGVAEHEFLSTVLESICCFDQCNASELMAFEHVARRYQLWEANYAEGLRDSVTGSSSTGRVLNSDESSLYFG